MLRKYWKKWAVSSLVLLLICINFFLIFHKDSKIERAKYVNEWAPVKIQDLLLSETKKGVIVPKQEEFVYFQGDKGSFAEFLVQEGDQVDKGTPLFRYSSDNLDQVIAQYEAEISKREREKLAIEENIDDLEDVLFGLPIVGEEEAFSMAAVASSIQAQIHEKELQLESVEAEIDRLKKLIGSLDEDHLIVESPIAGIVKKLSYDLQNPVVTITSEEKAVEGILDEEEYKRIKEGMKVFITSDSFARKIEGTISEVAVNPLEDPDVEKESRYLFSVQLDLSAGNFGDDLSAESTNETDAGSEGNRSADQDVNSGATEERTDEEDSRSGPSSRDQIDTGRDGSKSKSQESKNERGSIAPAAPSGREAPDRNPVPPEERFERDRIDGESSPGIQIEENARDLPFIQSEEDALLLKEEGGDLSSAEGELAELEGEDEGLEESDLVAGTHVDVKIVLDEVEDGLTLPAKAVRGGNIYVLRGNGRIEKRTVETGLSVGKTEEIRSGAEEGELAILNPGPIKDNTVFFTPIEIDEMNKDAFREFGKKMIIHYIARGLLTW